MTVNAAGAATDGCAKNTPLQRVDLHTHSTCSDGQWTPTDLVAEAARVGIGALALTDHDTVAGLEEFLSAGRSYGVWTVPAIEVSAALGDRPLHVLCYGVDPESPCWQELAAAREEGREEMYRLLFRQLREQGYRLEEEAARDGDGRLVAHPLESALRKAGHPDPAGETRRLFRPFILPVLYLRSISVERLARVIEGEKLLCAIAHPGREEAGVSVRLSDRDLERILAVLPLRALEAYHPMHTSAERDGVLALARKYGLLVTCGSDAHGHRVGRPPIGYSADLCEQFLREMRESPLVKTGAIW